jgi:hypothetical protein
MERFQRLPIIDRIDPRQLDLIKRTVAIAEGAQAITNAELGHFLELCAVYGLDPFAREAWIAKSKSGKLLIMVGRDGLRKVVDRNGLKMRGATIYAKDHFEVAHVDSPADATPGEWEAHGSEPFHRVAHRQKGIGAERGAVVGAWARVVERRTGAERGYFDAPLSEYLPANVSQYSPWSKQVSTMMLGAVERQAARQATPLGGLLAAGEDESANAARTIGAGVGSGEAPEWRGLTSEQIARAEAVFAKAREVGHAGLSDEASRRMELNGQPSDVIEARLSAWERELEGMEPVADAEVVPEPEREPETPESLEAQAIELLARADAAEADGEGAAAARLGERAEELHARAETLRGEQGALEGFTE